MDFTVGCSIETLGSDQFLGNLPILNIENPQYPGYLERDHPDDINQLLTAYGGRIILDGPYIDLNLGSPEAAVRAIALQRARSALSYAQSCGAEALIFQSTYLPFIGVDFYDKGWLQQSIESWTAVMEQDSPICVALCNTFEFYPDQLIEIVDTLSDPRLEIAFDVGHCLVWGKMDPASWYRKIRSRCRFVYLHSNDGTGDHHQSIRGGLLRDTGVLRSLKNELRAEAILILKYFDRETLKDYLQYLTALFQ